MKAILRKAFIKASLTKLYKLFFKVAGKVLPVDSKLVIFESFLGKQYSDSPRAIYEYMAEHNPEYKLIWSMDRSSIPYFKEQGIEMVPRFSIKWLVAMNRARYWVSNSRLPLWIPKPKHTEYLQTWHGTPLKRLAADMKDVQMPGTDIQRYKKNFKKASSKWDYLISPNAYSTEIFRRAFSFDKEVLETGYPRNDYLYNANQDSHISRLKEQMGIDLNKKVLLYAPTWRDNEYHHKGKYKYSSPLNLDKLQADLGEDYVVLMRMHYLVADQLDLSEYEGFVYDFSHYTDIRDLYLVSDILITDYSSVFFDFANLKRPMIFYVYDLEYYRDQLRGFYFDFEKEAPGPLVKTTDELVSAIKSGEEKFKPEQYEDFYRRFCEWEDGNASRRVVDRFIKT